MIVSLVLAAAVILPSCWNLLDSVLRHDAAAPHPPYVSYSERISIRQNGAPLLYSTAHVDYRDDGVARVEDQRFSYEPFLTRHAEPGPPELGPYGTGRAMWLPDKTMPVIADVRARGNITCTDSDVESYRGHQAYHLVFSGGTPNRAALRALWVDTRSQDVWKIIVTAPVAFAGNAQASAQMAQFQVELSYAGGYLIVDHVVWSYRQPEYSQYNDYFGEYTMSDYTFPQTLPPSYFEGASAQVLP